MSHHDLAPTTADESSSDRPALPRTWIDWLKVFGPGAVVASLTIGTGELIFSTRGGALFGYRILFVFTIISIMKWGLVLATSRHMLLTGVHPYERMLDLPGPRGWLPLMLLLMCAVCMPIWLSFHSGVLGNLASWVTNTRHLFGGGIDYLWGAAMLASVLILSASGGYAFMERIQMWIVAALVVCATLTLVLYRPDILQLAWGIVPQPLRYPDWLGAKYPEIVRHSEWVETTRYVGVIGGAGFDYLAYTSWLREKKWGILPRRPSRDELSRISLRPDHEIRRWLRAPVVDLSISFALVIAFSAVFVVSGALVLGPRETVPDEDNMLNLQAEFVTQIHHWLLPLYVTGAFFTMYGTLYGTVEIACSIGDEIIRSFRSEWTSDHSRKLKWAVVGWCASIAFGILTWLFIRQSGQVNDSNLVAQAVQASGEIAGSSKSDVPVRPISSPGKPKILLSLLTPVNLFTGVLSCGLICLVNLWTDRQYLPRELRLPKWLLALNVFSGLCFLGLGIKGYWDNENRLFAVGCMFALVSIAVIVAKMINTRKLSC